MENDQQNQHEYASLFLGDIPPVRYWAQSQSGKEENKPAFDTILGIKTERERQGKTMYKEKKMKLQFLLKQFARFSR
jgi:hypothetical protein